MIKRTLLSALETRLFKGKVILLFGARQVGKTTLVESLLSQRSERVLTLNGDESDVRALLADPTSSRLRTLVAGYDLVFIDEAQRITDIGLVLKLFADQIPEVQVIATGSSAFELAARTQEPLTGRKYEYHLHPLSYRELADHHGVLEEHRLLEQRLIFGCYPEIVTEPGEAGELLKLLAGSYLYKDLLMLEGLQKPALLDKLLRALALQLGSEVSYSELGRLVGADMQTVEKYIDLLEKAFVVFRLPAFSRNVRNEIRKGKKVYFRDNGIRNAILGSFLPLSQRTDAGGLWENYLISERAKLISVSGSVARAHFWRTTQQQEIDYVEEDAGTLKAWEFKWRRAGKARIPKTFSRAYPDARSAVIDQDSYGQFLTKL